jgi:hypothetical protein
MEEIVSQLAGSDRRTLAPASLSGKLTSKKWLSRIGTMLLRSLQECAITLGYIAFPLLPRCRELDRMVIQNPNRECVIGVPGNLIVNAIRPYVNLWDAAFAVVHAIGEYIVFRRAGELECVHLHFPCSVKAGLCKQERGRKQQHGKKVFHPATSSMSFGTLAEA